MMNQNSDPKSKNDQWLNATNRLTYTAFFLFYLIALPLLLGVIGAGITIQFVSERYLSGEINLGVFLNIVCISLYFFFIPFRKATTSYRKSSFQSNSERLTKISVENDNYSNSQTQNINYFGKIFDILEKKPMYMVNYFKKRSIFQVGIIIFPMFIFSFIIFTIGIVQNFYYLQSYFLIPIIIFIPLISKKYFNLYHHPITKSFDIEIKSSHNVNILLILYTLNVIPLSLGFNPVYLVILHTLFSLPYLVYLIQLSSPSKLKMTNISYIREDFTNEKNDSHYGHDGQDGHDGHDGQDGHDGHDGQDGQDGQDVVFYKQQAQKMVVGIFDLNQRISELIVILPTLLAIFIQAYFLFLENNVFDLFLLALNVISGMILFPKIIILYLFSNLSVNKTIRYNTFLSYGAVVSINLLLLSFAANPIGFLLINIIISLELYYEHLKSLILKPDFSKLFALEIIVSDVIFSFLLFSTSLSIRFMIFSFLFFLSLRIFLYLKILNKKHYFLLNSLTFLVFLLSISVFFIDLSISADNLIANSLFMTSIFYISIFFLPFFYYLKSKTSPKEFNKNYQRILIINWIPVYLGILLKLYFIFIETMNGQLTNSIEILVALSWSGIIVICIILFVLRFHHFFQIYSLKTQTQSQIFSKLCTILCISTLLSYYILPFVAIFLIISTICLGILLILNDLIKLENFTQKAVIFSKIKNLLFIINLLSTIGAIFYIFYEYLMINIISSSIIALIITFIYQNYIPLFRNFLMKEKNQKYPIYLLNTIECIIIIILGILQVNKYLLSTIIVNNPQITSWSFFLFFLNINLLFFSSLFLLKELFYGNYLDFNLFYKSAVSSGILLISSLFSFSLFCFINIFGLETNISVIISCFIIFFFLFLDYESIGWLSSIDVLYFPFLFLKTILIFFLVDLAFYPFSIVIRSNLSITFKALVYLFITHFYFVRNDKKATTHFQNKKIRSFVENIFNSNSFIKNLDKIQKIKESISESKLNQDEIEYYANNANQNENEYNANQNENEYFPDNSNQKKNNCEEIFLKIAKQTWTNSVKFLAKNRKNIDYIFIFSLIVILLPSMFQISSLFQEEFLNFTASIFYTRNIFIVLIFSILLFIVQTYITNFKNRKNYHPVFNRIFLISLLSLGLTSFYLMMEISISYKIIGGIGSLISLGFILYYSDPTSYKGFLLHSNLIFTNKEVSFSEVEVSKNHKIYFYLIILTLCINIFLQLGLFSDVAFSLSLIYISILLPKIYSTIHFKGAISVGFGILIPNILSYFDIASPLSHILLGISLCLCIQWAILIINVPKTYLKIRKYLGFISMVLIFATYFSFLIDYPQIVYYLTPYLTIGLFLFLLRLKKKLIHRAKLIQITLWLCLIISSYIVSDLYFFQSNSYIPYIHLYFSLTISGFIVIFYLKSQKEIPKWISQTNVFFTNIGFGALIYCLLSDMSFGEGSTPFNPAYSFAISFDLAILLYYIMLSIQQGKLSKSVWKKGWYLWNILPIVNFAMIAQAIDGINRITVALQVLNTDIEGSLIISIILCTFMYFPVFLYKLKKQFQKVVFGFWVELLILTIWIGENLYPQNIILKILFNALVGLALLEYIFYRFKQWKIFTFLWLIVAGINIAFVVYALRISLTFQLSLNFLIFGLYLMVYGNIPYVKKNNIILSVKTIAVGFLMAYISVIVLLYSFIVLIFIIPSISINITLIVMSFGLLTGKKAKLNENAIKFVLSVVSIVNIGMLIDSSFSLIEGLETFGLLMGIAFSLGTLRIFQGRKYLPEGGKNLFWVLMSLFFALSGSQIILDFTSLGHWFSSGLFILVFVSICYPLYRKFEKSLIIFAHNLSISFILFFMEYATMISHFINTYEILVFFTLILLLELYLLLSPMQEKYQLIEDKKIKVVVGFCIWIALSFLIPTLMVMLILLINVSTFSEFTLLLTFGIMSSFMLVVGISLLFSKNILTEESKIFVLLEQTRSLLIIGLYFSVSLLAAFLLPLGNIFGDLIHSENVFSADSFLISIQATVFFAMLFFFLYFVDHLIIKIIIPQSCFTACFVSIFSLSICLIVFLANMNISPLILAIQFLFINFLSLRFLKLSNLIKQKSLPSLLLSLNYILIMPLFGIWLGISNFPLLLSILLGISGFYSLIYFDIQIILRRENLQILLNALSYTLIQAQIAIWLYKVINPYVATIIFFLCLYFLFELEGIIHLLTYYSPFFKYLRVIPWLGFSISSIVAILTIEGYLIFDLNFILAFIILTIELIYLNFLFHRNMLHSRDSAHPKHENSLLKFAFIEEKIYHKRKALLGELIYGEVLVLFNQAVFTSLIRFQSDILYLKVLLFSLIILSNVIFVWLFLVFDKKFARLLESKDLNRFKSLLKDLTVINLCVVIWLLIFVLTIIINSILGPLDWYFVLILPTTISLIMLGVLEHYLHHNRKIDFLLFILSSVSFILLFQFLPGNYMFWAFAFVVILFPILFFLGLVKKIIIKMIKFIEKIIDKINEILQNIFQNIRLVAVRIVSWIERNLSLFTIGFGILLASISYLYLENLWISLLIALLLPWKYSPESKEGAEISIFRNKLLYRTLLFVCVVMISLDYVPVLSWILPLYLLLFLGYLIWVIKNSESLYNLSYAWRFLASLSAIIDFVVLVFIAFNI